MGSKETRYFDENGNETFKKKSHFPDTFDDEKGYLFWNQSSFVKTFQDVELPKELNKTEIANLFLLSKKVYSNTNMIGYRGHGGIRPMSIVQMSEVIRESGRRTTIFLNKMVKLRIMAKVNVKIGTDKVTQYYFNPIYFFSSNRLSLNLYLLFQQDLDPFIPQYAKDKFRLKLVK